MTSPLRGLLILMAPALLALAGCVDMTPVRGRVLSTTYAQRITDEAVRRDWAAIEALRARIAAARPGATLRYAIARAEAELDFAVEEYEENDRTGILDPLLDDARRLAMTQEPGHAGPVDLSLPELPGVNRLRQDLWLQAGQAKADPALLHCAGEPIARLEVGLLELGHEQFEVDVKLNTPEHAQPYESLVDHLARVLAETVARCRQQPAAAAPAAASEPVQAVAAGAPAGVAHTTLAAHALFAFDRHEPQHMRPEGRAQLAQFAAALARDPAAWQRLVVTGHTDRLGRHAPNLKLSLRRAESVRSELMRLGLPGERIEARGVGLLQPVKFCAGTSGEALRDCLQPNRRVEIELWR